MEKTRFTRRTVLATVPAIGGAAFLAACGTAQVAAPMEEKAAPEEKAEGRAGAGRGSATHLPLARLR